MEQLVVAGTILALLVVTGVLLVRRPRHPVTVVLAVMAAANLLGPIAPPGLENAIWSLGVLPLALLLIAFPDGCLASGRRRLFAITAGAIGASVLLSLVPGDWPVSQLTFPLAGALALLVIPAALIAVVWLFRLWRRSVAGRRWRIGLVLSAGLVLVGMYTVGPLLVGASSLLGLPMEPSSAISDAQAGLLFTLVPIAVGLSMLLEPVGHQVPALERVWPVLLAAAASLVVAGTTTAIVLAAGAQADDPALVAAVALAVGLAVWGVTAIARRGRELATTGPDRASSALAGLAERQSRAAGAEDAPDAAVAVVGESLDLRGVRLLACIDGRDEPIAAWGQVGSRAIERELWHAGERVGQVELTPHTDGVALDGAVLEPLLPSLGAIVAAAALERRLAEAHRHVRLVRDAERARLRSDLHDELSPSLAGIRLVLHAARARLAASGQLTHVGAAPPSPGRNGRPDGLAEAEALLERADGELARAGAVVRSIIEDLGPEDLMADGLLGAVRSRAADFEVPGTFAVDVSVSGPLPPLTAATDVAVLRVVSEAVCNAARHSGGSRCEVWVGPGARAGLRLVVCDDGHGLPDVRRRGLGLPSMAARVEAVGGTFAVGPVQPHGTRIEAWFPADQP